MALVETARETHRAQVALCTRKGEPGSLSPSTHSLRPTTAVQPYLSLSCICCEFSHASGFARLLLFPILSPLTMKLLISLISPRFSSNFSLSLDRARQVGGLLKSVTSGYTREARRVPPTRKGKLRHSTLSRLMKTP